MKHFGWYWNRGINVGLHLGPIDLYAQKDPRLIGVWLGDGLNLEWGLRPLVRRLK